MKGVFRKFEGVIAHPVNLIIDAWKNAKEIPEKWKK
jgi:hypothetical protein